MTNSISSFGTTPGQSTATLPRVTRARPAIMSMTNAAADRVRALVGHAADGPVGLRVGVKNGGCAGMSYTVELANDLRPTDEVVTHEGATVLIDPKAVLFLLGTQMDFKVDKLATQFVFNNPNQTSACGCGESVAITPALSRNS